MLAGLYLITTLIPFPVFPPSLRSRTWKPYLEFIYDPFFAVLFFWLSESTKTHELGEASFISSVQVGKQALEAKVSSWGRSCLSRLSFLNRPGKQSLDPDDGRAGLSVQRLAPDSGQVSALPVSAGQERSDFYLGFLFERHVPLNSPAYHPSMPCL